MSNQRVTQVTNKLEIQLKLVQSESGPGNIVGIQLKHISSESGPDNGVRNTAQASPVGEWPR